MYYTSNLSFLAIYCIICVYSTLHANTVHDVYKLVPTNYCFYFQNILYIMYLYTFVSFIHLLSCCIRKCESSQVSGSGTVASSWF